MNRLFFLLMNLIGVTALASEFYTSSEGRAPDSRTVQKQSKVPRINIYVTKKTAKGEEVYRVKTIPQIDIGLEPALTSRDGDRLVPKQLTLQINQVNSRTSPGVFTSPLFTEVEMNPAASAEIPTPLQVMAVPDRASVVPDVTPLAQIRAQPVQIFSDDELALLQVHVLNELKNKKEIALALAYHLLESKNKAVQNEGRYIYASLLHEFGVHSEAQVQLEKLVMTEDPIWSKEATLLLTKNAQEKDYDRSEDYQKWQKKYDVSTDAGGNQFFYNLGRAQTEKGELKEALVSLASIEKSSPLSERARHLESIIFYRTGQLPQAIQNETELLQDMIATNPSSELKSQVALLLARLHFQNSDYAHAYSNYLLVDRKTPDWPEAQMESAWSQILAKDYEGAAGNMFSLHTSFFKNTFAPDSYVVRAVGYVNLCQYGDGLKVIDDLNQKYNSTLKKMTEYSSLHSQPEDYYNSIRTILADVKMKDVEGIPRNLFYDIARNPQFKFYQSSINVLADEVAQLNAATLRIIDEERKQLANEHRNANLMSALKKARLNLKSLRASLVPSTTALKAKYKNLAAVALQSEFQKALGTLKHTLDQVEVLKYEIYSGAGEQLRYTASGGEITAKDSTHQLAPRPEHALQWKFQGEVWEDELGHYRSNLKNVCPQKS